MSEQKVLCSYCGKNVRMEGFDGCVDCENIRLDVELYELEVEAKKSTSK